ncbi:MAG: isoprenoid biosynthesis glyoxalase ElbB [bacterium]|nr:isoprenoid biosynthesis glyoxalase ElbB [Candidatus Sumerlaeota bacterium]
MGKRVAVLLSGCGVMDGSEIQESVFTLLALDNAGAQAVCFAPSGDQAEVFDHAAGKATGERRAMIAEAARIARGNIADVAQARAADFDALIIPGGLGSTKNLCTHAVDGLQARVHPDVARVVREFAAAGKPVGAMCLAPVTVAAVFKDDSVVKPQLTIGNDKATAAGIAGFGAVHHDCAVRDIIIDHRHRIVTTPAYMLGQGPAEVFVGVEKLVKAVLDFCAG